MMVRFLNSISSFSLILVLGCSNFESLQPGDSNKSDHDSNLRYDNSSKENGSESQDDQPSGFVVDEPVMVTGSFLVGCKIRSNQSNSQYGTCGVYQRDGRLKSQGVTFLSVTLKEPSGQSFEPKLQKSQNKDWHVAFDIPSKLQKTSFTINTRVSIDQKIETVEQNAKFRNPVSNSNDKEDLVNKPASPNSHVLFVTSEGYIPVNDFGSIQVANSLCNTIALDSTSELVKSKSYKALISDKNNPLRLSITINNDISNSKGNLISTGGNTSLFSGEGLTSNQDAYLDENGRPLSSKLVWTGTTTTGETDQASCDSWTNKNAVGRVGQVGSGFLQFDLANCSQRHRLYCLSQ